MLHLQTEANEEEESPLQVMPYIKPADIKLMVDT
jgi:hypothetical protein